METMHPVQKRIFQQMSPERKAAAFRTRYPELAEEEIQKMVKEAFLYAPT